MRQLLSPQISGLFLYLSIYHSIFLYIFLSSFSYVLEEKVAQHISLDSSP